MAQVALLQTEMNSGFRFVPRIGMNSAAGHAHMKKKTIIFTNKTKKEDDGTLCMRLSERE